MSATTSKYHIIPILFWIGLGLLVMILSYHLGLGGLHNPGPGLMPFLLGSLLFLVSIYLLLTFLYRGAGWGERVREEGHISYIRVSLVSLSLFAYSLLLEPLGFLITTILILIVLFRSMNNRWGSVLLASILTAFIAYLLFTYLGIRFPKGILRGL